MDRRSAQPHQGQPLLSAGPALDRARAALVLLHGRGATAAGMLELAERLAQPGWAAIAPQAAGGSWYPLPFLAPLAQNEPYLSSALARVSEVVAHIEAAGVPADRIVLLGFSQGACLACEWAARHPRRYGGVVILSGGLIGPEGTPRDYAGSFVGMPAFFGCSDRDPHIPLQRVHESAAVFERMGATVTKRIYPGMAHTINHDEYAWTRQLLRTVVGEEAEGRIDYR